MQNDSKAYVFFGPFGFSYSLKKENHCFLHFDFSVPALRIKSSFFCSLSTSSEVSSGQAYILISQVGSISLLSISFHLSFPNSKGSYFQLENQELWARDKSCRIKKMSDQTSFSLNRSKVELWLPGGNQKSKNTVGQREKLRLALELL